MAMPQSTLAAAIRAGQSRALGTPRWAGPRSAYIFLGAAALSLAYFGVRKAPESSWERVRMLLGATLGSLGSLPWAWRRGSEEGILAGVSEVKLDSDSEQKTDELDSDSGAMVWEHTVAQDALGAYGEPKEAAWQWAERPAGSWLGSGYGYCGAVAGGYNSSAAWARDADSSEATDPVCRGESPDYLAAGDEDAKSTAAWAARYAGDDPPIFRVMDLQPGRARAENEDANPSGMWAGRYVGSHPFLRATGLQSNLVREEAGDLEGSTFMRLEHWGETEGGCRCKVCEWRRKCVGEGSVEVEGEGEGRGSDGVGGLLESLKRLMLFASSATTESKMAVE